MRLKFSKSLDPLAVRLKLEITVQELDDRRLVEYQGAVCQFVALVHWIQTLVFRIILYITKMGGVS